jgi:hypothetical protein
MRLHCLQENASSVPTIFLTKNETLYGSVQKILSILRKKINEGAKKIGIG